MDRFWKPICMHVPASMCLQIYWCVQLQCTPPGRVEESETTQHSSQWVCGAPTQCHCQTMCLMDSIRCWTLCAKLWRYNNNAKYGINRDFRSQFVCWTLNTGDKSWCHNVCIVMSVFNVLGWSKSLHHMGRDLGITHFNFLPLYCQWTKLSWVPSSRGLSWCLTARRRV